MNTLFDVMLTNAVVASLMALTIGVFSMLSLGKNRPMLLHALWALVLVKLVTPPVFDVPVFHAATLSSAAAHTNDSDASKAARWGINRTHKRTPATLSLGFPLMPWKSVFVLLSGGGSILLLSCTCLQAKRLNRALRRGESSDPRIMRVAREAAHYVGQREPPAVSVVTARVPPMLWFWRRSPLVVLPRSLVNTLSDEQLRGVLSHEFAHFARRDHWLAAVSFIVAAIVWWNPVAWWARRELRALQEVLCDAQVIGRAPGSRAAYARALLQTLDFLQDEPVVANPLANSFGSRSFTKRRFDMIACPHVSLQISKGGLITLCCGFAVLLCTPARSDEEPIDLSKCPAKVQKTIQAEAHGGKIKEVEREKSESRVLFEAEIAIEDSVYEVLVREDGRLLSKELDVDDEKDSDADEHKDAEDEASEHEEAVTLKQLPKIVRSTLKRETQGGEIEELEREMKNGHVVYSADVEYDSDEGDLVYDVAIAENGVLLSKVLEEYEHDLHRESHEPDDDDEDDGGA